MGNVAVLAREGLDDPHARDVLGQRGRDEPESLADRRVRAGGVDAEEDRAHAHDRDHGEGREGQPPVEDEEQDRRADERQRALDECGDAVGDELVERFDVIRQAADDHAGPVALEEAQREALEVAEELDPEVGKDALADPAGQVGLHVAHAPVRESREQEGADDHPERAEIVVRDAVVDRVLGQKRRGESRCGRQQQREDRKNRSRPIRRGQAAERCEPPARPAPRPVLDLCAALHRQVAPGLPDPHCTRPFTCSRARPHPGGGEVHPPPAVSVSLKSARV
jgi:hypothetical protein